MTIDYTKLNNQSTAASSAAEYDQGLRAYMLRIYNYMAVALALTGITAFVVSSSPQLLSLFYVMEGGQPVGMSLLGWIVVFAPIGMVFWLGMKVMSMSIQSAQIAFWAFSVLMGLSLAHIFLIYTGESIARTFFITAATFGGMSLFGYTTKRDLTRMGSFLIMGLWGIFLASIVNIFLGSSGLNFAISILGVVIFTGLTAYDTQRIRDTYYQVGGGEMASKFAILGALNLYLDFINLFIMLLRFLGDRK